MAEVQGNPIEAWKLEIMAFVPPGLLKRRLDEMDLDEFMEAVAWARYMEDVLSAIISKGIAALFPEK